MHVWYHNEKKKTAGQMASTTSNSRDTSSSSKHVYISTSVCVCMCLCLCVRAHLSLTREAKIRVEKLGQSDLVDLYYRTCTATGIRWRTID